MFCGMHLLKPTALVYVGSLDGFGKGDGCKLLQGPCADVLVWRVNTAMAQLVIGLYLCCRKVTEN